MEDFGNFGIDYAYPSSSLASLFNSLENLTLRFPINDDGNGNGGNSGNSVISRNQFPTRPITGATIALTQPPPGFPVPVRALNPINSGLSFGVLCDMMRSKVGLRAFNNYLFSCTENQLLEVARMMTFPRRFFLELSTHWLGSSAVRKLLKKSNGVRIVDDVVFAAVRETFVELMISQYGHYVAIETLRLKKDDFKRHALNRAVKEHALELARDSKGCVSLNKYITETDERDEILETVAAHALWLSQDKSGNFVVQHALALQNPEIVKRIGMALKGSFVQMSMQKQGSFVVEKCLKSEGSRVFVLEEFVNSRELVRVSKNEFGNFVMQRVLEVAFNGYVEVYRQIVAKLIPKFGLLMSGYGKNIVHLINEQCRTSGINILL